MTSNGMHAELLDFVLPDFLRLAWVSEPAREVWSVRFQQVVRAWAELEWLSVASGIRNCALVRVPKRNNDAFLLKVEARGLKAAPLIPDESPQQPRGLNVSFQVAVGRAGEEL